MRAAAMLALIVSSGTAFAQGQTTNPRQPAPPPTPITQSSLPNSDKYKVEQKKPPVENAMKSIQAGNGTARSRQ